MVDSELHERLIGQIAIAPREAAQLALRLAEETDRRAASLAPALNRRQRRQQLAEPLARYPPSRAPRRDRSRSRRPRRIPGVTLTRLGSIRLPSWSVPNKPRAAQRSLGNPGPFRPWPCRALAFHSSSGSWTSTPTSTTVPALIARWVSSRHAEPVPRLHTARSSAGGRLGGLLNEYERRHEKSATG